LKKLFWASFVMLFAETMAIRWLGIEIPVLRAFPNLILMLVFIGASAGIAQPEKRVGKVKVIASLLCLIGSVIIVPVTGLKDISLRLDETNSPMAVVAGLTLILLNAFSLLALFQRNRLCRRRRIQKQTTTQGILSQHPGQHGRSAGLCHLLFSQYRAMDLAPRGNCLSVCI
jgi:hypothetical protein